MITILHMNLQSSEICSKIKCDSLIPNQQTTRISFLRSVDCYQQKFLKFPKIGIFHSYAELLQAALFESDCSVTSFVPQPFRFYIGRHSYTPDFYYVHNGKRTVLELKSAGSLDPKFYKPLNAFLKNKDINFKVITNQEILDQEIFCQSWLYIIRTLVNAKDIDTTGQENRILTNFIHKPKQKYGDLINIFDRFEKYEDEIALLRLVHRGKLSLAINKKLLTLDTEISLCQ